MRERSPAAHPILGEGDEVLGALYLRSFADVLVPGRNLSSALAILGGSLIVLTVVVGIIGVLFGRLTSRGLVRRLDYLDSATEAFQVPEFRDNLHVVTGRFVRNAHRHNMDVHVWTVNEAEDMGRSLELGVDGIITDYPDRLMRLLGRLGYLGGG